MVLCVCQGVRRWSFDNLDTKLRGGLVLLEEAAVGIPIAPATYVTGTLCPSNLLHIAMQVALDL